MVCRYLHEDLAIRKSIQKELADTAVSTNEIERTVNKVNVSLHTAKPGMVIGKAEQTLMHFRAALNKLTGKNKYINIGGKRPDLDAPPCWWRGIASSVEQRVAFSVVHKNKRSTCYACWS